MADEKNNLKTSSIIAALHYDLKNPTLARRVIYSGIEGDNRAITVEALSVKENVAVSGDVIKELKQRNRDKPDSDLVPTLRAPEKVEA